jgi:hypothetical protein
MQIKAGNSIDLLFTAKDKSGVIIATLGEATAIKFMIKANETDADSAAKISKTLGAGIVIDTPSFGNIKVSLTAANTAMLSAGIYFMALQIEWGAVVQEVTIKELYDDYVEINTLNVIQDIIR